MIRGAPRTLLIAFALALLWAAPVVAKPKPQPDYFPLRLHDWWKYRSTQASGAISEFTLTVVSEEKQPDGSVARCVELSNPSPLIRDWYTRTPIAVLLREEEYLGGGGKSAFEPPRLLLQLPLTARATWRWNGTGRGGVRIEESSEAFPSERIETPAGHFGAMKVVVHIEQGGAHAIKTSWYAPGVGLVRQATDSGGITSTTDLIDYSFRPRK